MNSFESFSRKLIFIAKDMVKKKSHQITNASGGQGSVRAVCDLVQCSIENNCYD